MDNISKKDLPEIKNFLQTNINKIDQTKLYSFIFKGWVKYTQEQAEKLVTSALTNAKSFRKGSVYPNPTESDLELIFILYVNGIIKDISSLQPLTKDYPHLQFLLDDESFDYASVDFSDYMWQNFARTPKLLQKFIDHKYALIPKIKKRITLDEATEFERKLYYKYLISDDDIWKN